MSRVDDVINVAGHRISGGALEQAILYHKSVVDCAIIGVDDKLKGTIPVAICVLRDGMLHALFGGDQWRSPSGVWGGAPTPCVHDSAFVHDQPVA